MTAKVKDLLNTIEELRQIYPDIENWDLYTLDGSYNVPENNMKLDNIIKSINEATFEVKHDPLNECWVIDSPDYYRERYHYKSKEEAEEDIERLRKCFLDELERFKEADTYIKEMTRRGWKFYANCDGDLFRDVADPVYHYSVDPDKKIFAIDNDY